MARGALVGYYQYIEESFSAQDTSKTFTWIPPPSGGHTVIYMLASTKSEHGGSLQLNT
jgi:hypothetical protein